MGNVTLIRFGTETDGDPARGCPHMAQWWPRFAALVWAVYGVRLEIIQAGGTAAKSGATHVQGTAVDWRTWRFRDKTVDAIVALAREAGAPATWMRSRRRYRQNFDDHVHLALDCPCVSGADYQIAAVKAGYNGLGSRGRGGKDYHPKPSVWRDWSTGLRWINAELDRLTPKPPAASAGASSNTDLERWLDAMDEKTLRKIIRDESQAGANAALWQPAIAGRADEWGASMRDSAARAASRGGSNAAALTRIESRIAALTSAMQTAAEGGVDMAAVEAAAERAAKKAADEALSGLGAALAQG